MSGEGTVTMQAPLSPSPGTPGEGRGGGSFACADNKAPSPTLPRRTGRGSRGTGTGWRWLAAVGVVCVGQATALSQARTSWTDGAHDGQWGNPANWSNGVPDANTLASFGGEDGTR